MKRTLFTLGMLVAVFGAATLSAQNWTTTTYQFSDQSKPGTLIVRGGEGNVTITGYSGRDIVLESESSPAGSEPPPDDEKARGLRKIFGGGLTVTTDSKNNSLVITRSMTHDDDIRVRVPENTKIVVGDGATRTISALGMLDQVKVTFSEPVIEQVPQTVKVTPAPEPAPELVTEARESDELYQQEIALKEKLKEKAAADRERQLALTRRVTGSYVGYGGGSVMGDVTVSGVTGDIEVGSVDGNIVLTGVTGRVSVNTTSGDVTVIFSTVRQGDEPLIASSVDGDIDVTMPASAKVDLAVRSMDGVLYTDFDIETKPVTRNASSDVYLWYGGAEQNMNGTINGGGRTMELRTIDGNVYIRKAK